MKPRKSSRTFGQSMIEFTFVGIPLILVLISIFEISRGMWMYHTLAYSVKAGVRYASVHGFNCAKAPNACTVNMGPSSMVASDCTKTPALPTVATVIWCTSVGLDPTATTLIFTDSNGSTSCLMNACPPTNFPSTGSAANLIGTPITIQIQTPFKSALAMFWPGSKPVSFSQTIFPASSTDTVKY